MISPNYKPTFLQKILGKNYKWWFLILFRFKSRTVSLFDSVLFVFGHLMILTGTMLTWWLAGGKIISLDLQQKWTYFIVGELLFCFIFTFTEFLGFDYINGRHVPDLLKPQNYLKMKLFDVYGESLAQNLVKGTVLLSIYVIFLALGWSRFNLQTAFLPFLLFPFSLLILYFSGLIVACSGFFLPRIHGVAMNYGYLLALLMGRIFPLDLLIPNFWTNLANPFAFTFYHPMQIYLGKYSPVQTLWVFLGGILWCFILYFLANFIFKMGLKRNESVGL